MRNIIEFNPQIYHSTLLSLEDGELNLIINFTILDLHTGVLLQLSENQIILKAYYACIELSKP